MTPTVKVNDPAIKGVPLILPEEERERPGGSVPIIDQIKGGSPSDRSVAEYDTLTVPFGKEEFVTVCACPFSVARKRRSIASQGRINAHRRTERKQRFIGHPFLPIQGRSFLPVHPIGPGGTVFTLLFPSICLLRYLCESFLPC